MLKEAEASVDENTKRSLRFWELLGGKKGVKCEERTETKLLHVTVTVVLHARVHDCDCSDLPCSS